MRCIWTDPSHFSLPLAFIPFTWWCKVIHIPTTELLEKAWLSFQLVTFWDLNIFIRKVMKNALAFCCYPVIYLSSPDCLDPIQLSLQHALENIQVLVLWLASVIGPQSVVPVVITYRQRRWECTDRVLLLGKCWTVWFPHGQNSLFCAGLITDLPDNPGHCYRSLYLSYCSLYCRGI